MNELCPEQKRRILQAVRVHYERRYPRDIDWEIAQIVVNCARADTLKEVREHLDSIGHCKLRI